MPVTENNQQEEETQLAQNEEEIKELIKAEIFNEDEDLGDLVLDTLVTALAKDDGGITAQLLGKSFLNSGNAIPRALIPDDVKDQLQMVLMLTHRKLMNFLQMNFKMNLKK